MANQLGIVEDEEPKRRRLGFLFEVVTVVLLGVLLALALQLWVTQVYAISGQSMEPTLSDGQRVMIFKLSPGLVEIEHGDVIIFQSPDQPQKNLIKRVIAVAGDEIAIEQGRVILNGKVLEEDYIRRDTSRHSRSIPAHVIKEGYVWVMGDNRPASQDSRYFDAVSVSSIRGKVLARVWPLDALSTFP